jgi:hypothetical protein
MGDLDAGARREHNLWLSSQYTTLSQTMAAGGQHPASVVACQATGDVHRVMAALWGKALNAPANQRLMFFQWAQDLLWRASGSLHATRPGARAALEDMRQAFLDALQPVNVPVFFTPLDHIRPGVDIDPAVWRDPLVADGGDWRQKVAAMQLQKVHLGDPAGLYAALRLALVEQNAAVDDLSLMSVWAKFLLVQWIVGANPTAAAVMETVRRVLSPTEQVRVDAFLASVQADRAWV